MGLGRTNHKSCKPNADSVSLRRSIRRGVPVEAAQRVMVSHISSHLISSHLIASHRIASHRIASHRIASHRIASHRIASQSSFEERKRERERTTPSVNSTSFNSG
jgi:hypothetical protein